MIKKLIITANLLFSTIFIFKFCMLIIPVAIDNKKDVIISELKGEYHVTEKLANIFYLAHELSGYSPIFIAELALSESGFNNNAISSAGYKGIMQIPVSIGVEGNIIEGVSILMEKFKIANGNTLKAVTLYKGGTPLAEKQARIFLANYERRTNRINNVNFQ